MKGRPQDRTVDLLLVRLWLSPYIVAFLSGGRVLSRLKAAYRAIIEPHFEPQFHFQRPTRFYAASAETAL